jgi:4-hydroxy-tetrahydrodipicolinate synthase
MTIGELQGRLKGVVGVLVSPFSSAGDLVERECESLSRRLDAAGIHVLTALGNTAEVYQLDDGERRRVLRSVAQGRESAALLAGIVGPFAESLRLAEFAASVEYDAVLLHDPPDTFASEAGLHTFIDRFAEASPLPVVLYPRTRRISTSGLVDLASNPRVVGMKYAVSDYSDISRLAENMQSSRCVLVCGLAELAFPMFAALGIEGFTSGLANVRPDLALGIWSAARDNDLKLLKKRLRPIVPFELLRLAKGGRFNVSVLKEALNCYGMGVGTVRPPCVALDARGISQLESILASWPDEVRTS